MEKEYEELSAVVNTFMQQGMPGLPDKIGIICIAVRLKDEDTTETSMTTNMAHESVLNIMSQLSEVKEKDVDGRLDHYIQNPKLN